MKCICGGNIEKVAFNTDLEDVDLYDCVCDKCGKHYILEFEKEED